MNKPTAGARPPALQPGALDSAGLRRAVLVLSTVQITSWGVLYYAFASLSPSITADTGWSNVAVTGAFSLAQFVSGGVGIWVGRHIDDFGPRKVMTAASLVAVPGVGAVALAPNLAAFYAGWVLVGVAMAGTLYPPAFAALTRWGGHQRVRALTTLTLVAGLASTVFAPLAAGLDDWIGWRHAYLVLLGVLVIITVPLHWWGLNHPWRHTHAAKAQDEPDDDEDKHDEAQDRAGREDARQADRVHADGVARSTPFVLLVAANALTSLAAFAVLINLIPMLIEQGMSRNLAALTLGLGGVGQVLGRLGYARFAGATTVRVRTVTTIGALATATAALAVAPANAGLLIGLGMVLGLARGIYTLIQATAITDRWGPAGYGRLNGILTAPALVAAAAAPFVGATLAHALGGYTDAFLLLAGVAVLAAALAAASPGAEPRRLLP